MTDRYWYDE